MDETMIKHKFYFSTTRHSRTVPSSELDARVVYGEGRTLQFWDVDDSVLGDGFMLEEMGLTGIAELNATFDTGIEGPAQLLSSTDLNDLALANDDG